MTHLEKRTLRVGLTPLCDCATLAVGQELGFFTAHGLDVRLEQQTSWATARDLLNIGALDAAHMLAPAPIAAWMGAGEKNIIAPMALSLNGNALAVSTALCATMCERDADSLRSPLSAAQALGGLARERALAGEKPLLFGAVFSESNHHLDLLRWLRAGGVRPGVDARIVIVPPTEVEAFLERGLIDGYCVGEPWGSLAVARGAGRIVASSYDLWSNRIEKVLGVGSQFASEYPRTLNALLQALIESARWTDQPHNRGAVAEILTHGGYVQAPLEVVRRSLTGQIPYAPDAPAIANPDFLVFHRYAANFPWRSQAAWMAKALVEGDICPAGGGTPVAAFRPALYARAAQELGEPFPLHDWKAEAAHATPWVLQDATAPIAMGVERSFDDEPASTLVGGAT